MRAGPVRRPRPACAEPEASDLRIVRILLLIVLVGAAAALSGGAALSHRPSGLDADGLALADGRAGVAAMDRFQRDVALAAALGGGLRGCQILQPSRHRLGRAARRDRRRRGRRGDARRLDHHPAGGEKPVPVAGPQRGPQGAGVSAGDVDRSRAAEAADPGNLSQHRRTRPVRPVRRRGRRRSMPSAIRRRRLSPREAALLAAILPNPVRRSARNPGPGVRRLAGTYMARAQAAACSAAGAKIALFEPIFGHFSRKPP